MLDLVKLFLEIETLQYLYIFLSLMGLFIIVTRKKMALEAVSPGYEVTNRIKDFRDTDHVGMHPEQTEKQSSRTRLYLLQMTLSILMSLVVSAGVFRYAFGESGQQIIQRIEDSRQWVDEPIIQSFVTHGRFNDAGTITIKYDLIIHLPNGKQLEDLKSTYRNPARLLDTYLKPYLYLISSATCASYSTNEAHANKFTDYIKSQVLNGVHPSLGILTSDIGKPPKSYGINIVVDTIEYTFEKSPPKTDVFQKKTDLSMEDYIISERRKREQKR